MVVVTNVEGGADRSLHQKLIENVEPIYEQSVEYSETPIGESPALSQIDRGSTRYAYQKEDSGGDLRGSINDSFLQASAEKMNTTLSTVEDSSG
jgi:hypothetical protein